MTGIERSPRWPAQGLRAVRATRSDTNRREIAMRYLYTMIAALGLLLLGTMPAVADHAQEWAANGESFVVDETTVHLQGGNTSVETAALGVNVDEGEIVTFEYELFGGAECIGGAPRVFLVINGANTNSWDQLQPSGEQCGTDGLVTFTAQNAGLVTVAGIVFDNGGAGHVLVSNLTIGGEVVHFLNPEPPPEVCEHDEDLLADDEACVEPDETDDDANDEDEQVDESNDDTTETESTSDDTTKPASTQETLPKTGVSPLLLAGAGAALLLAGGGLLFARRRTQ